MKTVIEIRKIFRLRNCFFALWKQDCTNGRQQVRRLSSDGHQTSIITSNKTLTIVAIAANMFWSLDSGKFLPLF
jgi:hypothetical protein